MDHLRTTCILLVLLIHSILPYATITYHDPQNYVFSIWPVVETGLQTNFNTFCVIVIDSFNMSLLFVIAGFFSSITINRIGVRSFIRNRLLRLGLPFLFLVTCYVPIGSYVGYIQSGQDCGYLCFWSTYYFQNHWHSGTSWFLWLLFAFSGTYALLVYLKVKFIQKHFEAGEAWYYKVLMLGFVAYMLMMLEPHLFTHLFGPFWLQPNRLLLYISLFIFGVRLGNSWRYESLMFSLEARWVRLWWVWISVSVMIYALIYYIILYRLDLDQQSIQLLQNLRGVSVNEKQLLNLGFFILYNLVFPIVCILMIYGLMGIYLKYINFHSRIFKYLSDHAYGISLVHFPIVVWLQYVLTQYDYPNVVKIALVFVLTFLICFVLSVLIRKIPAIKIVI
ncbi:MAG: acyltransferase family protein [Gammaproteobacteria bacterium]